MQIWLLGLELPPPGYCFEGNDISTNFKYIRNVVRVLDVYVLRNFPTLIDIRIAYTGNIMFPIVCSALRLFAAIFLYANN